MNANKENIVEHTNDISRIIAAGEQLADSGHLDTLRRLTEHLEALAVKEPPPTITYTDDGAHLVSVTLKGEDFSVGSWKSEEEAQQVGKQAAAFVERFRPYSFGIAIGQVQRFIDTHVKHRKLHTAACRKALEAFDLYYSAQEGEGAVCDTALEDAVLAVRGVADEKEKETLIDQMRLWGWPLRDEYIDDAFHGQNWPDEYYDKADELQTVPALVGFQITSEDDEAAPQPEQTSAEEAAAQ